MNKSLLKLIIACGINKSMLKLRACRNYCELVEIDKLVEINTSLLK